MISKYRVDEIILNDDDLSPLSPPCYFPSEDFAALYIRNRKKYLKFKREFHLMDTKTDKKINWTRIKNANPKDYIK